MRDDNGGRTGVLWEGGWRWGLGVGVWNGGTALGGALAFLLGMKSRITREQTPPSASRDGLTCGGWAYLDAHHAARTREERQGLPGLKSPSGGVQVL